MGFINNSCSFTRFRIIDPVANEIVTDLPQKLVQYSFKDIDGIPETQAYGWVAYEDMLDIEWTAAPPFKGEYVVFSLRLDTRRIPAGVIRKHLAIAIKEEKERAPGEKRKFVSRERKKELREQVELNLRLRFLPVPAEFNVVWNLRTQEVWFASTQAKMIDLFTEYFLNSFGLHLEQLNPYNLACALLDDERQETLDRIKATEFVASSGQQG